MSAFAPILETLSKPSEGDKLPAFVIYLTNGIAIQGDLRAWDKANNPTLICVSGRNVSGETPMNRLAAALLLKFYIDIQHIVAIRAD